MARVDRVIQVFCDYDELVEELAWKHNDDSQERRLTKLRYEVICLINELTRYGCRRKDYKHKEDF